MQTYEQMLKSALEKVSHPKEGERFEIPLVDIMVQGNFTIITNFSQICQALRREPSHVLKFLAKELAAPGSIDGQRATLQRKIFQKAIQSKLESYVKEFVLCKECKKPDTHFEKNQNITMLVCEACGAKSSVKKI